MKKIFFRYVCVIIIVCLSLTSCTNGSQKEKGVSNKEKVEQKEKDNKSVQVIKEYYENFLKTHYMENDQLFSNLSSTALEIIEFNEKDAVSVISGFDCAARLFYINDRLTAVIADLKDFKDNSFVFDIYIVSANGKKISEDLVVSNVTTWNRMGIFAKEDTIYFSCLDNDGRLYVFAVENGAKRDVKYISYEDWRSFEYEYIEKKNPPKMGIVGSKPLTLKEKYTFEEYENCVKKEFGIYSDLIMDNDEFVKLCSLQQMVPCDYFIDVLFDLHAVKSGISNNDFIEFLDCINSKNIESTFDIQIEYANYLMNKQYDNACGFVYCKEGVYYLTRCNLWETEAKKYEITYSFERWFEESGLIETGLFVVDKPENNDPYITVLAMDETHGEICESIGGITVGLKAYTEMEKQKVKEAYEQGE